MFKGQEKAGYKWMIGMVENKCSIMSTGGTGHAGDARGRKYAGTSFPVTPSIS